MTTLAPLALMFALASASASALDDDARYVEAVRAYEELELDDALAKFRELSVEPSLSDAEKARVLVWIGLTRAQQSELDEAEKAFDAALALDRAVRLPVRAAPKIAALFEEARERLPPVLPKTKRETTEPARETPPEEAPPQPPPPPPRETPVAAIATGVVGGVALLGAGVAAAFTTVHYSGAVDSDTPQPEAKALVDLANVELATAIVLGSAAVVLGGATVVLLDVGSEEPAP